MHPAHLRHRLLAKGAPAELADRLAAAAPGEREGLLRLVDRALGKAERLALEAEWAFGHGRAVLLFDVPALARLSPRGWRELVRERLPGSAELAAPGWVEVGPRPRPGALRDRVARLAFEADGLHLVVHIVKRLSVRQEDQRHAVEQTVPVELLVPSRQGGPVRAFATPANARAALRTALGWLAPGEAAEVSAVTFDEATVATVARALALEAAGVRGDDPLGRNGTVEVNGRQDGEQLLPLDVTSPEVARQVKAPRDERLYNYAYRHRDGFVERGRVRFKIRYRPAHLEFPVRTSRSAMDSVVAALLTALGRPLGH
jgi:hypothetical protein